ARLMDTACTMARIVARPSVSTSFLEGDRPRRAAGQRRSPARHLGGHVERLDHVGLVRQVRADEKLAAIEIRVLARGASEFVHEAFAIELVRRLSDATPRAYGSVKPGGVARVAVARHVVARGHVERRLRSEE